MALSGAEAAIGPINVLVNSAGARVQGISSEQELEKAVARLPLVRMATPEEIANAVVILASSKASYITSICMRMDGALKPIMV